MNSYLDNALNAEPSKFFKTERANQAVDFFASRGKFLLATSAKIVNVVSVFFELAFVESFAALFNYNDGRENFKASVEDLKNHITDFPVLFAGCIFGQSAAKWVWNRFNNTAIVVNVAS